MAFVSVRPSDGGWSQPVDRLHDGRLGAFFVFRNDDARVFLELIERSRWRGS
jgi:hypothetical protein